VLGNRTRRLAIVFLPVLAVALSGLGQAKILQWKATLTIPAALEVVPSKSDLEFQLEPGKAATIQLALSVGTNCWPLEFSLGFVHPSETDPAPSFAYRFWKEGDSAPPLWIKVPPFSLDAPLDLPFPGWTTYNLAIRVATSADLAPGEYLQLLRLCFRSVPARLVQLEDIPIRVTVR